MSVGLVTGASRGLGRALALGLARQGWSLVIDARNEEALHAAGQEMRLLQPPGAQLVAIAGDIIEARHRTELAGAAYALGGLDLLINNAGSLGPSPLPYLAHFPLEGLRQLFEVYPVAALGLIQETIDLLRATPTGGRVILVSSDAAIEAYPGWGGYGAAKAAVDHIAAVLAVEEPALRVWALDPGDLRTQMHQEAFLGEDISDRPEPDSVVPAILELIQSDRPSGRLRAADLHSPAPAP